MIDARISIGLPSHPKTKKIIRRLGTNGAWYLVCLFLWVAQNRSDGNLSGMSDDDIELAIDWDGATGQLIVAMVDVGFLDGEEGFRVIHDWNKHNPWAFNAEERSGRARFAGLCSKRGREFAEASMPEYAERLRQSGPSNKELANSQPPVEQVSGFSSTPSPTPSPTPTPLVKPTSRETGGGGAKKSGNFQADPDYLKIVGVANGR